MDLNRRSAAVLVCCLLLAVAGCAGGDGGASAPQSEGSGGGDGGAAPTGGEADMADDGGAMQASVEGRARIWTGEATVVVDSYDEARSAAVAATRERGGFVGGTEERVHTSGNRSWTTGTLTLRVPSGNYSGFLEEVRSLGRVESMSTQAEDVTNQLIDLNARIENLEGQREQLRELYNRTDDTEELLRIQQRLSEVQTEIERLSAQRQSLRNRVAYSTLTLHIEEEPPNRVVEAENWYDTPLLGAFLDSVNGVIVALRMLAVGAAYAAPFLVVFGGPMAALVWWRRRRDGGADGGIWVGSETGSDPEDTEEAEADGDEASAESTEHEETSGESEANDGAADDEGESEEKSEQTED